MASNPAQPSLSMPDSSTPNARAPCETATERNKASIDGRDMFSRGPRPSTTCMPSTIRWESGTATYTAPGTKGMPSLATCTGKPRTALRTISTMPVPCGDRCSTTSTAAGRSRGRSASSVRSAWLAPADPPIATMLRLFSIVTGHSHAVAHHYAELSSRRCGSRHESGLYRFGSAVRRGRRTAGGVHVRRHACGALRCLRNKMESMTAAIEDFGTRIARVLRLPLGRVIPYAYVVSQNAQGPAMQGPVCHSAPTRWCRMRCSYFFAVTPGVASRTRNSSVSSGRCSSSHLAMASSCGRICSHMRCVSTSPTVFAAPNSAV